MFKEQGFDNNWLLSTGEQDTQMRQWCGQKRFVWSRALAMEQATDWESRGRNGFAGLEGYSTVGLAGRHGR